MHEERITKATSRRVQIKHLTMFFIMTHFVFAEAKVLSIPDP